MTTATPMTIGLGMLTHQRRPGHGGAWEGDAAQIAEAAGLASLWFSEHHFSHDGYLPSAVPAMADLLARTQRIGMGAGVALLPFHDVPRLAASLRTVARAGRPIDYGVGLAYRDEEFDGFGLRRRDRAGIFERKLIELVDRLSDVEQVTIWVGAIAPPAVERAARLGLPVVFPTGSTHGEIGRRIERYREVWRGSGQPRFAVIRDVAIDGPGVDAEAWFHDVVDPVYVEYLAKTVVKRGDESVLGESLDDDETRLWLGRFRGAAAVGGGPAVEAEVAALAALGVDYCILRCWFPTVTADEQVASVERLATALAEVRMVGAVSS